MHRIRTQISWFIIALFISTLITTNFSIIPSVTAQTTQLFPDDISKILTANYTISQQLVHYSEGMFQGSGEVDCQFTNPTPNTDPSRIDIYANNQVFLWQRPCTTAANYSGQTWIITNGTTRYISQNPTYIATIDLTGMFTNLYLGDTLKGNYPQVFFLTDLMYILSVKDEEIFHFVGYTLVLFDNQLVNCTHMEYVGQILYAGDVCGLGTTPTVNCTFDYYYEQQTGLLVFSKSHMLEYLYSNPAIYQTQDISTILLSISFEGQPVTNNPNPVVNFFIGDSTFVLRVLVFGISIILATGIIAIIWIRKASLRKHARELLDYEEEHLFPKSPEDTTSENEPNELSDDPNPD